MHVKLLPYIDQVLNVYSAGRRRWALQISLHLLLILLTIVIIIVIVILVLRIVLSSIIVSILHNFFVEAVAINRVENGARYPLDVH